MIFSKEIMSDTPRLWTVYGIIALGVVGIVALLRWLIAHREGDIAPIDTVVDNEIVTSSQIPTSCQSVKDTMNCLMTQSDDDNLRTSLVDYYRETISAWNTLPTDALNKTCGESLSYIEKQIQLLS